MDSSFRKCYFLKSVIFLLFIKKVKNISLNYYQTHCYFNNILKNICQIYDLFYNCLREQLFIIQNKKIPLIAKNYFHK